MLDVSRGVDCLKRFVGVLRQDKVCDLRSFSEWKKKNTPLMEEIFLYRMVGKMPPISSLIGTSFHNKYPLVMFNYTAAAHNTLHKFPDGWTDLLRLCRGIVFDLETCELVALPFSKFFNYGGHPETMQIPDLWMEVTVKHDGHLGIIFRYRDDFIITTRGKFDSPTSLIASEMINRYAIAGRWAEDYPRNITTLVEIIHPETRVLTSYSEEKFYLIGAYNVRSYKDFSHGELLELGDDLDLDVTGLYQADSSSICFQNLLETMADRSVSNQEGYVIRFANGLRMKLKYETYIGKMVEKNLSYTYLMNRMISGSLQKMLLTLPEEIMAEAERMLGRILFSVSISGAPKDKWRNLYTLESKERCTEYFKSVCRDFVRSIWPE